MKKTLTLGLTVLQFIHTNRERNMQTTAAQDLQEMMNGWDTIMAAARQQFPAASEEELFEIASGAMRYALGSR